MANIGAQMFTLREHCKTLDDLARSLERVKQMGYDGVQGSASAWNTLDEGELKQIKKALDDNGLVCAATHESLDNLTDQRDAVVNKMNILGCKLTAIGGFSPGKDDWTRAKWDDFIKQYNELIPRYDEHGIRLGYHNHSHELAALPDGSVPLQLLVDGLDQRAWFEIDVYWIAHGLADPAAWIRKVAGRIPATHHKDGTMNPDRTAKMCEVGTGNLNWDAINAACREVGVEWYLVERDSGDLDPFESLEISVKNMRKMDL